MVETSDKITLPGLVRNGRIQGRRQNQLRLLEGVLLTKVPQELKEPDVPWQVTFAHATKDPQVRLE